MSKTRRPTMKIQPSRLTLRLTVCLRASACKPVFDEKTGDRKARWQGQLATGVTGGAPVVALGRRGGGLELAAGEPTHVLELFVADVRLAALIRGREAEHEARGERPRLRRDVVNLTDAHAGFFEDLT